MSITVDSETCGSLAFTPGKDDQERLNCLGLDDRKKIEAKLKDILRRELKNTLAPQLTDQSIDEHLHPERRINHAPTFSSAG